MVYSQASHFKTSQPSVEMIPLGGSLDNTVVVYIIIPPTVFRMNQLTVFLENLCKIQDASIICQPRFFCFYCCQPLLLKFLNKCPYLKPSQIQIARTSLYTSDIHIYLSYINIFCPTIMTIIYALYLSYCILKPLNALEINLVNHQCTCNIKFD